MDGSDDARDLADLLGLPQALPRRTPEVSPLLQTPPSVGPAPPSPMRWPALNSPESVPASGVSSSMADWPGVDEPAARRATAPGPTVVAVFSPKGGVGKTTVSIMLGAVLARRGRMANGGQVRVCLVDLDLFGDVGARLGKAVPTVLDLVRGHPSITPEDVERHLVEERSSGLRVLLAPVTPDAVNAAVLTPSVYRRIVETLSAWHDVVILDCGTELTDPVLTSYAIPSADRVLFVVNNEAATLAAARKALALMADKPMSVPMGRISLVLNQRADEVGIGDTDVLRSLPRVRRIAARFPDDRRLFVGSANQGRPILTSTDPVVRQGIADLVAAAVPDIHLVDLDVIVPAPAPKPLLARILARAAAHALRPS